MSSVTISTSSAMEISQPNAKVPLSTAAFIPPDEKNDDAALEAATYLNYDDKYSVRGMPTHKVMMIRGQGEFLWDIDGKRYIDFNGGFSACNQGHCHPKIVDAVMKQCQLLTLPSRSVHVPQYGLFCKRLCELTSFDKVAAMNGGAEAIDMAMKLARGWAYKVKGVEQDKALILTADSNYHGRTLTVLSASTDEGYRKNCGPYMPNVGPNCAGNTIRFGVIEDLKASFEKCGSQIAAFLVEPVQGHAGCLAPPDGYLQQVRDLCTKHNILFIADEIQAGLGRTGHFLSYQAAGVKADMAILGKSLSGGLYPISAVVGTADAMSGLEDGQYGSTFSGNPLASSVALAALDVIVDEDLPSRAATLGERFASRLNAIDSPYFDKITGMGLFRSIYVHETHPQGRVTGARLAALCLKRGLLLNFSGRRLRICPSLVIDEKVMIEGVDILEQALKDLPDMEDI